MNQRWVVTALTVMLLVMTFHGYRLNCKLDEVNERYKKALDQTAVLETLCFKLRLERDRFKDALEEVLKEKLPEPFIPLQI